MSFDRDLYRDQLYTETQSRILVNIPRLTGTLSVIGSSTILFIILRDSKRKLKRVYHRLLLAFSALDVLCSFNFALSAVVVPKGTPGVWGARGSMATCEASGFVTQFTFSTGLYGAFICVYYVLVLRYRVKERTLATSIEPIVHAIALLVPTGLGILMLKKDMYNPGNIVVGWCFLNCYPMDCLRNEEIECERGSTYEPWLALHNIPFIVMFAAVVLSSLLTFLKVYTVEKRGSRWTITDRHSRIRISETASQAFLYVAAYLITYLWYGIAGVLGPETTSENRDFYFAMVLMVKIFQPLQGFWNCFIYIRPRYNAIRREEQLHWYNALYAVVMDKGVRRDAPPTDWQRSSKRLQIGSRQLNLPASSWTVSCPENQYDKDGFITSYERNRSFIGPLPLQSPARSSRLAEINHHEISPLPDVERVIDDARASNSEDTNSESEILHSRQDRKVESSRKRGDDSADTFLQNQSEDHTLH